jgi:cytochrome c oxidase subunit 2
MALAGMIWLSQASPALAFSLNPEAGSPGIGDVNTLHTIIFFLIVVAIVVVNVAILRAARPRYRAVPGQGGQAGGKTSRLVAGLAVVALGVFVLGAVFSGNSRQVPETTSTADVPGMNADRVLELKATGQQWLWRYDYPNGSFGYHRLVVPVGVTVALDLVSSDVVHSWNVPSLTGKAQAVPGKTNRIHFRVDREGSFKGRAATLSGQGYAWMEAQVDGVSPDEYRDYLAGLRKDLLAAQDSVERDLLNEGEAASR